MFFPERFQQGMLYRVNLHSESRPNGEVIAVRIISVFKRDKGGRLQEGAKLMSVI
mgnify:CR=1 FL=1